MSDKSFVLMSLKEDKVKKMTQVLNNDTCRRILDFLSTKERATATEISKELKIAMSTVHYNLKQLADNGLVTSDEYHYSEKGKEVIHYGLANRYIIIAPKEDKTVFEKLKGFLPIALITAGAGILMYFLEKNWHNLTGVLGSGKLMMASESADTMQRTILETEIITDAVQEPAMLLAEPAMKIAETTITEPTTSMLIAPWFIAGAVFVILIMIAFEITKNKK